MSRQALGAVAEQLEPQLALDSLRPGDGGESDTALAAVTGRSHDYWASSAAPSAGSSRGLAAFGSLRRPEANPRSAERRRRRPRPALRRSLPLVAASSAAAASAAASSAGASSPAASSAGAPSAALLGDRRFCSASSSATCFGLGGRLGRCSLDFLGDDGLGFFAACSCGAAAASAASASLAARSSTRSLAFSPGSAFFGLLRAARSRIRRHRGSAARGPTAGRRRPANARCAPRRASRARANPSPAAGCRCRPSR